ncbi:hypothetical protein HNR12_003737 [Streptomonospora nanhaiensis]|uniref:Uncharacterized protein n=1 Tax=Streptomonospora nanhaiensis TaxID=1323731 RepID=A0A853BR35_9ACTN|nr:hypothetical protein [Streptomonospora nanhaiensis]
MKAVLPVVLGNGDDDTSDLPDWAKDVKPGPKAPPQR